MPSADNQHLGNVDLRAVDRGLVRRWLDVPSEVRERYELWPIVGPYPTDPYAAIAETEAVMNAMPHDDLDVDDAVIDADWVAQREEQQAQSPAERWTIFARERTTRRLVGYTQVFFYADTHNAFSNAPMLAINDEVGFVVTAKQTVWEADVDKVLRRVASA